ncbi:MAG: proteasome activator [Acidimicrobiia bacterium]
METSSISPVHAPDGSVIEKPGKLMRIAAIARAMLDEARDTPCDEAGCERFRTIYEETIRELGSLLSDTLTAELDHLAITFRTRPSPSELRVAQAELVGWLEGLFHGISAAASGRAEEATEEAEALANGSVLELVDLPGFYL